MNDDLEELTKENFEHSIATIVSNYNKDIERLLNMVRVADFYENRDYLVKYYYEPKKNVYSVKYSKKEIGFKPVYSKPKKKSPQLTLF